MLERLNELMEGAAPEDSPEKVFVQYYGSALRGNTLLSIVIEKKGDLTRYTLDEMGMLILGYALGEKNRIDNEDGISLDNDNKQTH